MQICLYSNCTRAQLIGQHEVRDSYLICVLLQFTHPFTDEILTEDFLMLSANA